MPKPLFKVRLSRDMDAWFDVTKDGRFLIPVQVDQTGEHADNRGGQLASGVEKVEISDFRSGFVAQPEVGGVQGPITHDQSLVPNRECRGGKSLNDRKHFCAAALSIGRLGGSRWRGGPMDIGTYFGTDGWICPSTRAAEGRRSRSRMWPVVWPWHGSRKGFEAVSQFTDARVRGRAFARRRFLHWPEPHELSKNLHWLASSRALRLLPSCIVAPQCGQRHAVVLAIAQDC